MLKKVRISRQSSSNFDPTICTRLEGRFSIYFCTTCTRSFSVCKITALHSGERRKDPRAALGRASNKFLEIRRIEPNQVASRLRAYRGGGCRSHENSQLAK